MPWNRVLRFTDPLPCQPAVQASDVEILPTMRGDLQLEITQIGMNRLWMQRSPRFRGICYQCLPSTRRPV